MSIEMFPVQIVSDFSSSVPLASQPNQSLLPMISGFYPNLVLHIGITFYTSQVFRTTFTNISLAIVIIDMGITFKVNQPIKQTPSSLLPWVMASFQPQPWTDNSKRCQCNSNQPHKRWDHPLIFLWSAPLFITEFRSIRSFLINGWFSQPDRNQLMMIYISYYTSY